MSTNYVPSDQEGSPALNGLFALVITAALFGIMPLMQFLESQVRDDKINFAVDTSVPPPPPPPEDQPPPPEDQKDIEEPKMEEPPPPMTLAQLEMALNPGSGDAMGDFGFGNFDTGIDALDGMKIFSLADVDKKPSPLFQTKAIYPYALQQSKTKGSVVVEFIIDINGKVRNARATKSTHREFEQPAIDSLMRSSFNPGTIDGKPVPVRVRQTIQFSP